LLQKRIDIVQCVEKLPKGSTILLLNAPSAPLAASRRFDVDALSDNCQSCQADAPEVIA
jgi:hypothetical protein